MKLPIRIRLAVVYGGMFLVVTVLLELCTYFSVRQTVHSIVDRELETRLAGIYDHLSRHIDRLAYTELSNSLQAHPAFQPAFLRIREAHGPILFDGNMPGATIDYRAQPARQTLGIQNRTLRVLSIRRRIQGRDYDLALGTDLLIPGAILQRLWLVILLLTPAVLLAASWAGYWVSAWAMAPVSR